MITLSAIGRLGKDSETKQVGDKVVSNFTMAIDVGYGDKKKTVWLSCSIWNKEKLAKFLVKGTLVYVQGEPSVRAYINNKTNEANASMDVVVYDIKLLSGGESKSEQVFVSGSTTAQTREVKKEITKDISSISELNKLLDSRDDDNDLPF